MNQAHHQHGAHAGTGATAFYSRVTREESVRKGLSLPNQRKRFQELAERHSWNFVAFEEPRQVSGELGESERPALHEMLEAVRRGEVSRVVVRHLDRLGRGPVLEELLAELRTRGVDLQTFEGPVDFASAAGRLAVRVQGAVGAFEVERGGERSRESRRQRARQGVYAGGPAPYGYTSQARLRAELVAEYGPEGAERARRESQERIPISPGLIIDEAEAQVVREIFAKYLAGKGPRALAGEFNRRGLTRRGAKWWAVLIRKVLRDPKVAGFTTFDEEAYANRRPSSSPIHRQARYPALHEAIIDVETFERAQVRLEHGRRRIAGFERTSRIYPLTGVAHCAVGHPMKGSCGDTGGDGRHHYYRCRPRAHRGTDSGLGGCDAPYIRADRAEAMVREVLVEVLTAPEHVLRYLEAANQKAQEESPERRRELQAVAAEIDDVHRRRSKLYALLERAGDPEREQALLGRVVELNREIRDLQEKQAELDRRIVPLRERGVTEAEVVAYLADLRDLLSEDRAAAKQLVLLMLEHHDLRVDILDAYQVRVSMQLDPSRIISGDSGARTPRLVAHVRPKHALTIDAGRARPVSNEDWAAAENATGRFCACGCGERLLVQPIHRAPGVGIPRFVQGHHRMDMTEFVAALNASGLLTVSQAATRLGVSSNTMRRAEGHGWVTPQWHPWGGRQPMRCYAEADLPELRRRLVAAGFRFRDDGG